jgi:DNA-binding MarR family transcriptional regulator/predicted RNA-binding Zn-ribbon protein involved in translation (DUF1610 family)
LTIFSRTGNNNRAFIESLALPVQRLNLAGGFNKGFFYLEETMAIVKDENFITVQGWMVNRLGLSGNELLVFALIYGFTQDGETIFTGSATYIGKWCGISRQSVSKITQKLIEKGIIEKQSIRGIGDKYRAVIMFTPTCKESLHGMERKFTPTCKESLHNNILNNNKDINNNNEEAGVQMYENCTSEIEIDKELDKKPIKPKKEVTYPDIKEVEEYILSKQLAVDPYIFIDYYQKRDWSDRDGKKVKNWKNKALNWDTNEKKRNPQAEPYSPTSSSSRKIDTPPRGKHCPECGEDAIFNSRCEKCGAMYRTDGSRIT